MLVSTAVSVGDYVVYDCNTTEMKMLRWMQGKTRKDRIRNEKFRSDAMVKPITTCVTQIRLSWYGHAMRREDTNVAKQVTAMTVGEGRDLEEGSD